MDTNQVSMHITITISDIHTISIGDMCTKYTTLYIYIYIYIYIYTVLKMIFGRLVVLSEYYNIIMA